jgi:hypothetical protein
MAIPAYNIVQAEFFLVGVKSAKSMRALSVQMKERLLDGLELTLATGTEVKSSIKAGVRFYDTDGSLTKKVAHIQAWEDAYTAALERLGNSSTSRFGRWWLGRRLRRLGSKKEPEKDRLVAYAAQAVIQALADKRLVGIERNDHSYRLIHRNEAYELAESVNRAESAWVFIFKPNDLLADKNEIIAASMF